MNLGSIRETKIKSPLESQEQKAIIKWANYSVSTYPELIWLHSIPNGGKRSPREAAALKAEGVKAGVSDLFLPVKRSVFSGLYIELKQRNNGRPSKEQLEFLDFVRSQGFMGEVCHGFIEAKQLIINYLSQ